MEVPIETRFFSPPETPRFSEFPILASATGANPNILMVDSTLWAFSSFDMDDGSFSIAANVMVSLTVNIEYMMSACST